MLVQIMLVILAMIVCWVVVTAGSVVRSSDHGCDPCYDRVLGCNDCWICCALLQIMVVILAMTMCCVVTTAGSVVRSFRS